MWFKYHSTIKHLNQKMDLSLLQIYQTTYECNLPSTDFTWVYFLRKLATKSKIKWSLFTYVLLNNVNRTLFSLLFPSPILHKAQFQQILQDQVQQILLSSESSTRLFHCDLQFEFDSEYLGFCLLLLPWLAIFWSALGNPCWIS